MRSHDKKHFLKLVVIIFLCTSCGSSKTGRVIGSAHVNSANAVINKTASVSTPVPPSSQCPFGGQIIKTGIERMRFDTGEEYFEVLDEFLICNQSADNGNVQIKDSKMTSKIEEPGENCPNGGLAIYQDENFIGYLCNGVDGLSGNDGKDGEQMLLKSESIAPGVGSDCLYGGKRLSWGLDIVNPNGMLEAEEIIGSMLTCEAAPAICGGSFEARSNLDVAELASCQTTITGNVSLNGLEITDLSPLANLTHIRGNLLLKATGLSDLKGLEKLEYIGGDFIIYDDQNRSLSSFAALAKLEEIGGYFYIGNIAGPSDFTEMQSIKKIRQLGTHDVGPITSYDGLQNLKSLKLDKISKSISSLTGFDNLVELDTPGFSLGTGGNEQIQDLSPLANLEYLGSLKISYGALINNSDLQYLSKVKSLGDVYIFGPGPIDDISALSPSKLTGSFELVGMGSMAGLDSFFAKITEIPGNLRINDQQSISNLSFLSSVQEIGLTFTLQNNPSITNFDGMENIRRIGYKRSSDSGAALNIVDGPEIMCGLTSLVSIKGEVYANDGFFKDGKSRLSLPQPSCK